MVELLIQLISGAIGGNIAGRALDKSSLGTLGNSIVGILGGGLGGQVLGLIGLGGGAASGGLDIGSIISSIAGGGVGGGILLAVIGAVRKQMGKAT